MQAWIWLTARKRFQRVAIRRRAMANLTINEKDFKMKRSLCLSLALLPALAVLAATPAEKAAETAAVRYADSLESGRIVDLYSMMPASYQKDVANVVRTFGATMDADIWKEVQSLAGLLADVAVAKSDLLASMAAESLAAEGTPRPAAEIAPDIAKAAKAFKSLSGKLTLDTLKAGDVKALLAYPEFSAIGESSKSMNKDAIAGAVVGSKAAEDGSVVVTFKQKDGETEDVPFVAVDGTWVPKEMADGWKEGTDEMLKGIKEMKFDAAKKQQFLSMMPMLKSGLESAKMATTKEQLQQSLMMSVFSAAMLMGGPGGAPGSSAGADE